MEPLFQVIFTSVTGVLTFILGHRRGKAETEGVLLQNLEKSIDIYQTIISDMKDEVQQLRTKIEKLENKVEDLLKENHELKKLMRERDAVTDTPKQ